ncbi:hypothetical protein ISF_07208 [Cordyceps fumosorosea ARSEF 2679]|uniref:DUF8035 domain-containing protein n=1 Tax=Cordyceps fumosorosea (strain ARSEF 2679) TaxID=1081104 RepID=A0A167Q4Q9_CORFA|nr:hypothetical protein ISF_07208 [Cordyceps fumosorosea ARSEF 2679]OAA57287.1 hypothetical protein ISF_07208 [Cordyceps fumosorosea ARSEF 2679]
MSGSAIARRIDHVDALARTLYQRTKQIPPPAFEDAAVAVRRMYMTLRGLRAEADDPKSVLSQSDSPATSFAALGPMIDHCEAALRQLETVLDRFDAAGKKDNLAGRVASVELAKKELDLAIFLDFVQTRAKTTSTTTAQQSADHMKHDVGATTSNVYSRHSHVRKADTEATLPQYKKTLERLGLTHDEIEAEAAVVEAERRRQSSELKGICDATNIPTYQSVAEFEVNTAPQVRHPVQLPVVPPKVPIPPPKEKSSPPKNEKSGLGINADASPTGNHSPTVLPTQYSFNVPYASMEDDKEPDLSMALISTKELVSMDSLNQNMNGMNIHTDPTTAHSSRLGDGPSRSPTLPTVVAGSPQQHYSSVASDARTQIFAGTSPGRSSCLGPDRYGREIPPEAQWTKIRRTLVSPEVLHRAGVRYEARPEYVAILGRLSRHEIAEFARQSAECRAARPSRPPLPPRRSDDDARPTNTKADVKANGDGARPTNLDTKSKTEGARPIKADVQSHGDGARPRNLDTKSHHSDDDILYDSDDSTDYSDYHRTHGKGTRTYPYIVSPPSKNSKTSPSTTVKPKPILKNKHENHVRFDPEPHDLEHSSSAPSSYNHDRHRDYYYGQGSSSSSRRYREHYDRDYDDRDERPHRSHRDRRDRRKKSWGETLGAVGIGSAALLLGGVGF